MRLRASVSEVTAEFATAMVVAASSENLAWICSSISLGILADPDPPVDNNIKI